MPVLPHHISFCPHEQDEEGGETHLVDTNGFTVKFDLIHDFTRIIRVLLGQELAKPISLMSHRDTILR